MVVKLTARKENNEIHINGSSIRYGFSEDGKPDKTIYLDTKHISWFYGYGEEERSTTSIQMDDGTRITIGIPVDDFEAVINPKEMPL